MGDRFGKDREVSDVSGRGRQRVNVREENENWPFPVICQLLDLFRQFWPVGITGKRMG